MFTCKLFAQSTNFIFHNLGERQGLSANYCYKILKDSRGMLWFSTVNGLSRFDGSHFYNFRAGKDSTSFVNGNILDLCEDKDGNIWGGAGSGIFCYQTKKNTFNNYIPPTYDFARGIKNIVCDKRGDIWASSEWNILKLNKKKNIFEEIGPLTYNKDSLGSYSVRQNGLIEDPSGKGLWFATRSGLHYYKLAEEKFYSYKNKPGDSLFTNHSVAALSLSRSGKCWFFDNVTKEIISFDPGTQKIIQRINMDSVLPNAFARTLFEDSKHKLWFSTWNNEIVVIDDATKISTPIICKDDNPLSIAGDSFWDAWEDEDNTIWLATSGGISTCNYSKNAYSIIPVIENVPELKNSSLGAFSIDRRDKSWWIAAEGDISIIHYYPETGKYFFYNFSKAIKNSLGQLPGPVFAIDFMDGQTFVSTHTGVWQLNEKTKVLIPFEKEFEGLPDVHYNYLTQRGNEVWFNSNEGFIKWDKISNRAIKIKVPVDTFFDGQRPNYSLLFFDKTGRPWFVPAFGWLAYINERNEVVTKYYIKNKAKELAGYLTSIAEDHLGNLWMASIGVGLYKYSIAKDEMKLFDQSDGIPTYISRLITDKENRLWIAAGNKFAIFDPVTNGISHYNLPLYENKMNFTNPFCMDSSGAILAVVNKEIVKFIPQQLKLKPVIKQPIVSMIKISGQEKLIGDETNLVLKPDENSLEFYFGSLINGEIFPYSIEYQLDGFDKTWLTSNSTFSALYSNLNPGKYIFKVKAVAKDKSWQTPEKRVAITITTPFYKARWFWILIGCLICTGFLLFNRFRFIKQKQILTLETKAQQLEKEKTMVMYESLKQQLNPHFLFNSLTSLSGLIETDQEMAGAFLEQMSGIYRYILKHGDRETVLLKNEIEFVQFYINLQQTRFKNGLLVDINIPEEYLYAKIAPVTLQNMIENAIKHNVIDTAYPLVVHIFIEDDYIVVKNNLQKKNRVETSNKKGLEQFITLYRYLSDKPITIEETMTHFIIKIPLI